LSDSSEQPDAAWRTALLARLDQPPLAQREPLWWGEATIGSVEPVVVQRLAAAAPLVAQSLGGVAGWRVSGESLDASLAMLAQALRAAGFVRAWRDELLAMTDAQGHELARVERGVVRLLGIATHAVHLLGFAPDGRHWLQQRAFDKGDDPGLWDTLVGGMVPAGESVMHALERETLEEAGLSLSQLGALERGGQLVTRRPSTSVPHGYVIEKLDWYRCLVPDGVSPENRDGEVAEFRLMTREEVHQRLQRDEVTLDAAAMLLAAGV
jgi:8-oxo-dGTP pyrophosphatase MutT (NUDIX family)